MNGEKKYWFPAKTFGWGWGLPQTWQGWVVFLVYLLAVAAGLFLFPPERRMVAFQAWVWTWTGALVFICWKTGEPPGRWRWGRK